MSWRSCIRLWLAWMCIGTRLLSQFSRPWRSAGWAIMTFGGNPGGGVGHRADPGCYVHRACPRVACQTGGERAAAAGTSRRARRPLGDKRRRVHVPATNEEGFMGHCATRRTTRFPRCASERHGQEPPERRMLDIPQPSASEAETHGTGRRAAARPGRRLALLCGVVVLVVGGVRAVAESGALSAESPVVRSTISAGGGEGFGHSCGVRTRRHRGLLGG